MERLGLFDPDIAPDRLALMFMSSSEAIEDCAYTSGLSPTNLRGGLGVAAFRAACAQVSAVRGEGLTAAQKRLTDWAIPTELFIYPAQLPAFVTAGQARK